MSTADGRILGLSPVIVKGPTDLLLNIVLVAEGFQEGDLPLFALYAQRFVDRLYSTPPFTEARCGMNIFRIDVASTDTGADDPHECGGTGRMAATYFDASICERVINVDESNVINVVKRLVPQWHLIMVVVNSQTWAGTGGQIAKTSVAPGWENSAIHEMGHSLFGLADEYEYLLGCGRDTDRNEWPSLLGIRVEPVEPNISIWADRKGLKWGDLVNAGTPVPTTTNNNPTVCDPQSSPVLVGTVGAFEGAGTYHSKVYRPEFSCMMRQTGKPFCAVCTRTIKATIDAYHRIGVSFGPTRFIRIHDYANLNGFIGGFPNFHEADYGQGLVFGSILLHSNAAEKRDVPAAQLANPGDFAERFRAVNDYSSGNGFIGGFPNFHEADYGQGLVFGCIMLRPSAADWRDVPAMELGYPIDIAQRFRAVHDYSVAHGYVSGYPNFHQANHGQGIVYGCILIKFSAGEWRDVPIRDFCTPTKRLNDAQFESQLVLKRMQRRQTQIVTVAMHNKGTATWSKSKFYKLGSQTPQDNLLWGLGRVELALPVAPGTTASFRFNIIAPGTPGRYMFQWRMLEELVEWFGDFTPAVPITVPMTPVSNVAVIPMANGQLQLWALDGGGGLFSTWKTSIDPNADWAPWSDFLAEVGVLLRVQQVVVGRLPDRRLELWAIDGAGRVFTTWKTSTDSNASWAPWSDFLAEVGVLPGVQQVAVAPLPDGRLELWAIDGAGRLFTTWKTSTDPNASWAPWSDFLAEVGGLAGVQQVAVATLPDGRLELWAIDGAGGLFTTWKTNVDPNAGWAPWSDFLAEVGGLAGIQQVAVASLPDGRLELWAINGAGRLFTTWKTSVDPNAGWAPWSDFLAEVGGLEGGAQRVAVAPLSDGRLEVWATNGSGDLFTTWKTSPDPNASWAPWLNFSEA